MEQNKEYWNKRGVNVFYTKGKYPEGWDEWMEYKKLASSTKRIEVELSKAEAVYIEKQPRNIQNEIFKQILLQYAFLDLAMRIKKQGLSVFTYIPTPHLKQRFSDEDIRFLSTLHAHLLDRKVLLPVHVKGVVFQAMQQMVGGNIANYRFFVFDHEYNALENRHKEDFEVYDWQEIGTEKFN
ncbi:MAG: hypothetical protein HC831_08980 [Chloroflexia bacterium]|nr:hypothetical protein [Chloroflexia bacterium]